MSQPHDSPNYHPLVKWVARSLRGRCQVPAGATLVVGCSGGADSVALVRALALLAGRRRWGLGLVVAHVQHHLRGELAERDAMFVGRLATDLGLGYARRDIHPGDAAGNLEAVSRKQRYAALVSVAVERGASAVATAHHADDQLETVLMRLIRGSSAAGLRGVAWRRRLRVEAGDGGDASARVFAVRPMLGVDRADVLDFLRTIGQGWVEDATNLDTSRTRARLRHEVIPLIKQMRGDAADKAVALGDHFDQVHRLVREQARAVPAGKTLDELPRDEARRLNPIVLTQVLRRDLMGVGVPADRLPGHALHPVVEAVHDGEGGVRWFDFANGVRIEVSRERVRVLRG